MPSEGAAFIGLLNVFHRFRKSTPTAAAQAFFNTIPFFPFPVRESDGLQYPHAC
jgi:hypothetical protein